MIKPSPDDDSAAHDEPVAGGSDLSAPAYRELDVTGSGTLNFREDSAFMPPGGEEPPPEFTPYEAEFFQGSYGEVISHDLHLNEDGKSLAID